MKALSLLIKPAAGLCNMNCGYCFYRTASEGRENRIMSTETADLLVQKIAEYMPDRTSISFQGGEPTLAGADFFRHFINKMEEKKIRRVSYSMQTNGLLLDRKFAELFREYDFLLGISIDGNRKTNDRYRLDRNGNSVLPQVLSAAALLDKYEVPYNVLSVIDDKNAADIDSTYSYFRKHGFGYLQFIPYIDEQPGIGLSVEAYEAFLKRVFDLWYEDDLKGRNVFVRHISNYISILNGFPPENCAMCGYCGNYLVIEANGDIYPCDFYCREEYRLGNIRDGNPFELTGKHEDFLHQSEIIHEKCKTCKYYNLCRGGCKRDRINGFTENRYCRAYYNFFEYAMTRLERAARKYDDEDIFDR